VGDGNGDGIRVRLRNFVVGRTAGSTGIGTTLDLCAFRSEDLRRVRNFLPKIRERCKLTNLVDSRTRDEYRGEQTQRPSQPCSRDLEFGLLA